MNSESSIRKRYDDLKRRGVTILDIPYDTLPKAFLEKLFKQCNTSFNYFFDEFIVDYNRKLLTEQLLNDICKGDEQEYRKLYFRLLSHNADKRTKNAVQKELDLLKYCHNKSVVRVPFLGLSSRRRVIWKSNMQSPIRVFMHVADKLDIRVGARLYNLPLWQYIGELIAEGMLKMFVRTSTTPEERALLGAKVYEDVSEEVTEDAQDAVYERIIHEYKSAMRSVYLHKDPELRRDFDMTALYMLRNKRIGNLSTLPTDIDLQYIDEMIDAPNTLIKQKVSIIEGDDELTEPLLIADVKRILENNVERMMGKPVGINEVVGEPMIRATLDSFRDTIFKRNVTKHTKIRDVWNQMRTVIRSMLETLIIINNTPELDIDTITDDICKDIFLRAVQEGILEEDSDDLLELDKELLNRIRYAIDDATMDGGITKSALRRAIGRNHRRYLSVVDEILGHLLETGKYSYVNGRYIAVAGGTYNVRMVQSVKRGRPTNDADGEIVQNIEGRLDAYVPIPKAPKKPKNDKK